METPSVSNASRYSRMVQEFRQKERTAEVEGRTGSAETARDKASQNKAAEAEAAKTATGSSSETPAADKSTAQLEREKQQIISELSKRDTEVRNHEQAHSSVGGRYASAPEYDLTEGPEGRQYATGGHVNIDTSPVPDDPEATLTKADVVEKAALAPVQPSDQDLKVAAEARNMGNEARVEIQNQKAEALKGDAGESEDATEKESEKTEAARDDTAVAASEPDAPKSFSFGLSFPQKFVGAEQQGIGETYAQQLKGRFDTLGLSYPPQDIGQQVSVVA